MTSTDHAADWGRNYLRTQAGPRLAAARKRQREAQAELIAQLRDTDLGRAFAAAHAAHLAVVEETRLANDARTAAGQSPTRVPPEEFVTRINNIPDTTPVIDPLARAVEQAAAEIMADYDRPKTLDELTPDELAEIATEEAKAREQAKTDATQQLEYNGAAVEEFTVHHPTGVQLLARRNLKTGQTLYFRNGSPVEPEQITREFEAAKRARAQAESRKREDRQAEKLKAQKAAHSWDD